MNQADLPMAKMPNGPLWYLCKACDGTGEAARAKDDDKAAAKRRRDCNGCGGTGEVLESRR